MLRAVIAAAFCIFAMQAAAIDASDRYRSPRNPERAIRRSTELIILHTTEAPARSSLNKVSDRGECHFCVTDEGQVYRIVDRDREAFHAGRSMWNGKEDVDKFSIGIECVGYHNKPMPLVQLKAIARLIHELESMYHLSDEAVLTHSQIAYGAPNRYHHRRHRGRKRCGMLFATATVRRILGLKRRIAYDPDVRAKRLVVGDAYLNRVLYGGFDTMASHYPNIPAARPTQTSKPPQPPQPSKPPQRRSPPKPQPLSISTSDLVARGYRIVGVITKDQTPRKIVGEKWNTDNVFYTIRGKAVPGSQIDPSRLEKGTSIWLKSK